MDLVSPSIPPIAPAGISGLASSWSSFPLALDISPITLVVLTILVGIFIAAMTVILLYHWRRFPFEHETFRFAERVYLMGVVGFFAAALVGILFS